MKIDTRVTILFADGHHGFSERIDSPFPGGLSSDYSPQHGIDDAVELDTTEAVTDLATDPLPDGATDPLPGPSRSISFVTDTDNSITTRYSNMSTVPI